MAGEYVLRMKYGLAGTVESIIWDGQDYADRPFDTSNGEDISGVVVTLTTMSSSVAGVVNDNGAPLTTGAAVIAFPVERDRWKNYGFTPIRITSALTTTAGRFQIEGFRRASTTSSRCPRRRSARGSTWRFWRARRRASHVRIDRSDTKIAGLALGLVK